jgi:glucose-1-phosphate thymidylyltransferase
MDSPVGLVLAGGSGSRLYPLTASFSKQLQPVYDKPMIYYPISTLMMAGITSIAIVSTPSDTPVFQKLLGDGSRLGVHFSYHVQDRPRGIADAFRVAKSAIAGKCVCLILGDNIFYGKLDFLRNALRERNGATIFGYQVHDPERYGVVEFDASGHVSSIEEKPAVPKSKFAIPGVYVFPEDVATKACTLQPSARGELEITDLHKLYHQEQRLQVIPIGRGIAWLDTGTPESLMDAATFIHAIEKRQGTKIACLEEIAYRKGFISRTIFENTIAALPECDYKQYCHNVLHNE